MTYAVAVAVYDEDADISCKVVGLTTSEKKAKTIQMKTLYGMMETYLLWGPYDGGEFASLNDFVAYQENRMWGWKDNSKLSAIWFNADDFEQAVISITQI